MKDNKNLLIGGIVVVVVVAAVVYFLTKADEEGPIIVKNGSMYVEIASGSWGDGGAHWVYESGQNHGGDLWVKVTTNSQSCTGTGRPVQVTYSEAAFQTTFNVAAGRTIVAPKNGFTLNGQRLTHEGPGYITGVRIGGNDLSCGMTSTNLVEINICSSGSVGACQ
jgi:hypothetical protein